MTVDLLVLLVMIYCLFFVGLIVVVVIFFFFLMIRRPPRSTQSRSSAASDVYKRQDLDSAVRRLFEVIQNHMQIAVIDLKNSVDPQLIFETLNARGTPLDPSDLIKNFLFHQVALEGANGEELYAEYWLSLIHI